MTLLRGFAVVVASASLASSAIAQSGAVTSTAERSTSSIEFSAAVGAGLHTSISGQFQGGETTREVGPYLTPEFSLTFKDGESSASLGYKVEMSGMQQFGAKSGSMADKWYFDHNPSFKASTPIVGSLRANILVDSILRQVAKDANKGSNKIEVFINPDVSYKFTDSVSVALGYIFYSFDAYDTMIFSRGRARVLGATDRSLAAANKAAVAGQTPDTSSLDILNAGVVTLKANLSEGTDLTSYVRIGRYTTSGSTALPENGNPDRTQYRTQHALSFPTPIRNLSGALTYRLNIEDLANTSDVAWLNRAKLNASYEISKNVAVELENTFDVTQDDWFRTPAQFENESYLGMKYTF